LKGIYLQDVSVDKELGSGNYGTAYVGTWKGGIVTSQFTFRKLDHKNIVKMFGLYKHGRDIMLVREFSHRGDLKSFLMKQEKQLNPVDAVNM
jgi:serine/threonine protein kinase